MSRIEWHVQNVRGFKSQEKKVNFLQHDIIGIMVMLSMTNNISNEYMYPIYKFTTSVCLSVTEVLGGGGNGGPVEAAGDLSATRNRFHFLINCCISLWTQFVCVSRERERACARSFSSWTTFFPVAKEQEMVEEAVDDARSVC